MAETRAKNPEHKRIAEAALFVSGRALDVNDLARAMGVMSIGYVRELMEELITDYNSSTSAFMVEKLGDRYTLGIKQQYVEKVSSLAGAPDISKGALRILAYISKNEPVMQSSIVKAFGSTTYEYMKELMEKDFIKRSPVGRTKKIETTPTFREYFNI
ncbi:MAG: SMC-Scp complex subunit ScpB [Candidatus Micrarchaeota archaeon]|nr:SMC-Scp complex subunit ScpB [Candidatus Micrarchaeota archaeon]